MNAITEVRKSVRESPELGAYRVRAALEQIGIHLSQATCGRLLALNRKLYGVPKPSGGVPRERREMPFKAHFKHEIWSVDVRYIEEHNLGFPESVYLISVLENYSRSCLASKISSTQNQWDYLEVLFAALSAFGAPSVMAVGFFVVIRQWMCMPLWGSKKIKSRSDKPGKIISNRTSISSAKWRMPSSQGTHLGRDDHRSSHLDA